MTTQEFDKFVNETKALFNIKMSELEYEIWTETFQHMAYESAKDMAKKCYRAETGRVTLAHLIKYKPGERNVAAEIWDKTEREECAVCLGEGCVTVQRKVGKITYEFAQRCVCKNGKRFMAYPEANLTELRQMKRMGRNRFVFEIHKSTATVAEVKALMNRANKAKERKQVKDDGEGWAE